MNLTNQPSCTDLVNWFYDIVKHNPNCLYCGGQVSKQCGAKTKPYIDFQCKDCQIDFQCKDCQEGYSYWKENSDWKESSDFNFTCYEFLIYVGYGKIAIRRWGQDLRIHDWIEIPPFQIQFHDKSALYAKLKMILLFR